MLQGMVSTLPRPGPDAPETAWRETVQGGLDALGILDPRDALQATYAIHIIALGAAADDACRLAMEAGATGAQALRQRASAASMMRAMGVAARLLAVQRLAPAVAARAWGGAATELTVGWRAMPARPVEPVRGMPAPGVQAEIEAELEPVVRWIDELDDKELAIAVEADRREKAGEPPLPRKPGQPMVLYRYKPEDYIRRFKPDARAKRPYPGWETMTMAERREFFGYTYTGPGGPPEALTPASRDAMLAEIAAREAAGVEVAAETETEPDTAVAAVKVA